MPLIFLDSRKKAFFFGWIALFCTIVLGDQEKQPEIGILFNKFFPVTVYSKIIDTGFKVWSDLHYLHDMHITQRLSHGEVLLILEINLGRMVYIKQMLTELIASLTENSPYQYNFDDFYYIFKNIVHYARFLPDYDPELAFCFDKEQEAIRYFLDSYGLLVVTDDI